MFLTPLPDLFGTALFHNAARMTLLVVSASIAPNETTKVVNPPRDLLPISCHQYTPTGGQMMFCWLKGAANQPEALHPMMAYEQFRRLVRGSTFAFSSATTSLPFWVVMPVSV